MAPPLTIGCDIYSYMHKTTQYRRTWNTDAMLYNRYNTLAITMQVNYMNNICYLTTECTDFYQQPHLEGRSGVS